VGDALSGVEAATTQLGSAAVLEDTAGAVDAAVGGVTDDVAPAIGDALTSSVDAGSALLADAPTVSITPFATSVPEVDGVLPPLDAVTVAVASDRGAEPTAPVPTDGAEVASGDPSPQQPLVDGAAVTAAPTAADAGGADPLSPLVPALEPTGVSPFGPPDVLERAPEGFGAVGASATPEPPIAAGADVDPIVVPPMSGSEVAAAPPPTAGGGSVLDVIAQAGQDTRLVASAAVITMAGAALLAPRSGGVGADARMAFTNVRLLPCLIQESTGRQLTALTHALAPAAAPAAAALDSGTTALVAPTDRLAVKGAHELGGLRGLAGGLSEGISRATREATGEAAEGLNDNRLVVQVGMLLGVVYLAFLSVWFWATRARMGERA
jgi:hypothetical protein